MNRVISHIFIRFGSILFMKTRGVITGFSTLEWKLTFLLLNCSRDIDCGSGSGEWSIFHQTSQKAYLILSSFSIFHRFLCLLSSSKFDSWKQKNTDGNGSKIWRQRKNLLIIDFIMQALPFIILIAVTPAMGNKLFADSLKSFSSFVILFVLQEKLWSSGFIVCFFVLCFLLFLFFN